MKNRKLLAGTLAYLGVLSTPAQAQSADESLICAGMAVTVPSGAENADNVTVYRDSVAISGLDEVDSSDGAQYAFQLRTQQRLTYVDTAIVDSNSSVSFSSAIYVGRNGYIGTSHDNGEITTRLLGDTEALTPRGSRMAFNDVAKHAENMRISYNYCMEQVRIGQPLRNSR